jgi:hypothetical protein
MGFGISSASQTLLDFLLPPRFFSFKTHHLQVSTKDGWVKNTKQRSFLNEKEGFKHNRTKSIFCASIQFH